MTDNNTIMDNVQVEQNYLESALLQRTVQVDAYSPVSAVNDKKNAAILLINDGQDLPKMPFAEILSTLNAQQLIAPLWCFGIYCGADRKMEYGIAARKDYKGRGAKAALYSKFVLEELMPFIYKTYGLNGVREKAFAGFSLGGLSALDIVWNHPDEFSKAGLFSPSLWWRSKSYKDGYNDAQDRIMHEQIKQGKYHRGLKFFFECGTLDETADRNNNGIIDSIDDTLDLIKELRRKGYDGRSIEYLELADGRHDVATWAKAFPYFLQWGWGTKKL